MQPDYVGFETKQREELLSQFGTFSPGERDLFHTLCQNWQERIPYGRFSAFLNRENGGTTSDLLSLMDKLRRNRMGLLRTIIQDGRRSRETIILTRQGSSRFYTELFDEYFTDMLESIVNPLPLASHIEKNFGEIPRDALQAVSAAKAATYFGGKATSAPPLAIASLGDDALLITQKNLRAFVNVAILKMRYFLNNTTLLGILAKLQDTSLLNIKQRCGGKEPAFWLGITKTIVERARDIEAMRNVNVDPNFFHVAYLLRGLIESQIVEAEQKKQEAENRRLDLEAIALALKEAPDGLIDQSQLSRMLEAQKEKYGDRFAEFRDEFYERYVHARSR
ncbi:MAG: hypothetical protein MI724_12325, partial [Spirochaetales bacterium]|nr:hypothetical protein [Spirochaetales bacterium]